jgi:hypothetical protein
MLTGAVKLLFWFAICILYTELINESIMKRNFLNTMMVCIATGLVLVSCKKDNTSAAAAKPHEGYWKGKYGVGSNRPTLDYEILIKANGTFRIYEGADTASAVKYNGTYTVSGTTFSGTYNLVGDVVQYSTLAGFNAQFTGMDGTYGTGSSTSGGGSYTLTKQ